MNRERYQIRHNIHRTTADLDYILECFGDYLSEIHDYPPDVYGFDAVYLYLCNKHHWPIAQSRAMDKEDIRLVLAKEMKGWTLPKEARHPGQVPTDD